MGTEAEVMSESAGRPRWTRLAVLGLLMIAAAPALMIVSGLAYGLDMGEQIGFMGSVFAVALAGALLVWFLPWWSRILGILAAVAAGMGMFWTAFGLAQPGNVFDFLPGLLVVPGALIAIVSCIASIVAHRRDHRGAVATGGERNWIRSILASLGAAALISGILTLTGKQTASVANPAQVVTSKDFLFHPEEFEVEGGSTILVKNADPFFHTFTIDELDISIDLTAGDEISVEIPTKTGTYRFYCVPHSSSGSDEPSERSGTEEMDEEEEDDGDMSGTMTIT